MAGFQVLISGLRRAEQQLEKQLTSIRTTIASLQSGGVASARRGRPPGKRGPGRPAGKGKRKRRKMSKEARAKIAAAQKKRWAAQKAGEKK